MLITEIVRDIVKSDDHCWEYYGDRVRVMIGEIARWEENEQGGRVGGKIGFEVGFGDHIGEFDVSAHHWGPNPRDTSAQYLSRWFSLDIGRWGIAISWRGREITNEQWIPRWQLDKAGNVLPDYA